MSLLLFGRPIALGISMLNKLFFLFIKTQFGQTSIFILNNGKGLGVCVYIKKDWKYKTLGKKKVRIYMGVENPRTTTSRKMGVVGDT